MRVTVMQPTYWPPLHYFQRVLGTDVFVVLDNAQYVRKGWQNECWLRAKEGPKVVLTVPVRHIGRPFLINEGETDETKQWRRKHRLAFESLLGGTPFYRAVAGTLADLLESPSSSFGDLVQTTVLWPLTRLGYGGVPRLASTMPVEGKASEWMLNFCTHLGATEYVCGKPAYENYLDRPAFEAAGVKLIVQDWICPPYPQRWPGFVANLSILDLVANVGWECAREILR